MLLENVRLAIMALKANKLRTFLTMLGIIIGLASMVIIMTLGSAMNNYVSDQLGEFGANNFYIYLTMKQYDENGNELDYDSARNPKDSDYINKEMMEDLLTKYNDKVDGIILSSSVGSAKIQQGKDYANIRVTGVNPLAMRGQKVTLLAGNNIAQTDYTRGSKVCLVSDKYVNNLYDGDANAALGDTVDAAIGGKYYSYTIIGVYSSNSRDSMAAGTGEKNVTTDCFVPLRALTNQNPDLIKNMSELQLAAKEGQDPTLVSYEIAKYLNERYYKNNDTFELMYYSLKQEVESIQGVLNAVKYAFMAVGAISLLVGGIGVMNIMIVSIVERTREIGTRKALGATNGYIRLQFITESMVVCLVGGAIGVVLGLLLGQGVALLLGASGNPSVGGVVGCLIFSMAFGVFFGYYPANRAAKLNPIDALRYE